jgi:3-methyladenine DNA glycosylase AlkD
VNFIGVPLQELRVLLRPFVAEVKKLPANDSWQICDELFASGIMEESTAAISFIKARSSNCSPNDLDLLKRWIDLYVRDWANCDDLCCHFIGCEVVKNPALGVKIVEWAKSDLPYTRRAAAVSFVKAAAIGQEWENIIRVCDALLNEEEEIVQKGYGWLLKEAAKANEQGVFDYVWANKEIMPRTALRYAIENMPRELKKMAMER